jgi:hypothetical protein
MRLERNTGGAEAEPFDPGNVTPEFLALAGDQFLRVNPDGTATVRLEGGVEMEIYRGWLAVRPDGSGPGQAGFITPENIGDEAWRNYRPA